ncbi:MAG: hypothetical protein L0322_03600 [Chloroflexi bacterium]|nr:hypothetical protein [Chloroflexota bacterium]
MVVSSRKAGLVLVALVFLAAIVLGVVGAGVVRASGESAVPKCSWPVFDASSGFYSVTCKPGDGATVTGVQTTKLVPLVGSTIKYRYAPRGARIEFNDPGGACYRWTVTDSNGNTNDYTQGYPNFTAPFCNN